MILLEINNRIVEETLTLKFNNALAGLVEDLMDWLHAEISLTEHHLARNGTGPLVRRSAIPKVHYSEGPMCTGV